MAVIKDRYMLEHPLKLLSTQTNCIINLFSNLQCNAPWVQGTKVQGYRRYSTDAKQINFMSFQRLSAKEWLKIKKAVLSSENLTDMGAISREDFN